MKQIEFNIEEISYLKETLGVVLKDIREIYNITDQQNLFIEANIAEKNNYLLWIDSERITLVNMQNNPKDCVIDFCYSSMWYDFGLSYFILKEKGIDSYDWYKSPMTFSQNPYLEVVYGFVIGYEQTRKNLIEHIEGIHNKKEEFINRLNQVRGKFGNEVFVDFGTNNSLNMRPLEITEEDGKKVGTIDFGSRIVKIITEGDIVLTKVEKAKQLNKSKEK